MAQFLSNALTLSNINRFSKFFHCQNQEKIRNNIITKDPITPQVCRYTTFWNASVLKATTENKTTFVTTHFKKVTTGFNKKCAIFGPRCRYYVNVCVHMMCLFCCKDGTNDWSWDRSHHWLLCGRRSYPSFSGHLCHHLHNPVSINCRLYMHIDSERGIVLRLQSLFIAKWQLVICRPMCMLCVEMKETERRPLAFSRRGLARQFLLLNTA